MGESKHTPGPWEFVPAGKWYIGSGCGVQARTPEGPGWPTPSATGYYAIACPPPYGKDGQAEQEANARLIAAAPDMYEALRRQAENIRRWLATGEPASPDESRSISEQIDAALAKAETR